MTDLRETVARYLPQARRDSWKQARAYAAPALKFANRNPVLLISAGLLALAGIVAFTNRKKIAAKAQPVLADAKTKGQAMLESASAKGQELIEEAKTRGEAIVDRVRSRKAATSHLTPTGIH